jgi:hypothetical protein
VKSPVSNSVSFKQQTVLFSSSSVFSRHLEHVFNDPKKHTVRVAGRAFFFDRMLWDFKGVTSSRAWLKSYDPIRDSTIDFRGMALPVSATCPLT